METLFLYKTKTFKVYSYDTDRFYMFKETDNGRFFVWESEFTRNDQKMVTSSTVEERKQMEEKGRVFELLKTKYEYYLSCELEAKEKLDDPRISNNYIGIPEEKAGGYYHSENNKQPFCWSYLIEPNNYANLYVKKALDNSEIVLENGVPKDYGTDFFNDIKFDKELNKALLEELKTLITGDNFESYKNASDNLYLRSLIAQIKMEQLMGRQARVINEDMEKIKDFDLIKSYLAFSITVNARDKKAYTGCYNNNN